MSASPGEGLVRPSSNELGLLDRRRLDRYRRGCGESVWKEGFDRSGALMLLLVSGLEPIQAAAERLLHDAAAGR